MTTSITAQQYRDMADALEAHENGRPTEYKSIYGGKWSSNNIEPPANKPAPAPPKKRKETPMKPANAREVEPETLPPAAKSINEMTDAEIEEGAKETMIRAGFCPHCGKAIQ